MADDVFAPWDYMTMALTMWVVAEATRPPQKHETRRRADTSELGDRSSGRVAWSHGEGRSRAKPKQEGDESGVGVAGKTCSDVSTPKH